MVTRGELGKALVKLGYNDHEAWGYTKDGMSVTHPQVSSDLNSLLVCHFNVKREMLTGIYFNSVRRIDIAKQIISKLQNKITEPNLDHKGYVRAKFIVPEDMLLDDLIYLTERCKISHLGGILENGK